MIEKVLALDLSTKSGWAVGTIENNELTLIDYGKIEKISEPNEKYPGSYVTWSYQCFGKVIELIEQYAPEVLIIEETAGGSKSAYSQKILEFIQFLVARFIKETGIKSVYYQTETWRRIVGCKMTTQEKEHNKLLKSLKKQNSDIRVFKDSNGKRMGKIGRKHVNVRVANEWYGKVLREPLILANEDQADALLLLKAYHIQKVSNEQ